MQKSNRNRQQKRQRHAEKRKQSKQRAAKAAAAESLPSKTSSLVELALQGDFGPAWINADYGDQAYFHLPVEVVISRKLPRGKFLAYRLLVDRGCCGITKSMLLDPANIHELTDKVASFPNHGTDRLIRCDPEIAQSVALHAIDYAATLGIEPVVGFDAKWLEPRPQPLLDTPGARPERPLYAPHPDDDPRPVFWKLVEKLGVEGFDCDFEGYDDLVRDELAHPNHPWDPADAGSVPGRIDWRAATQRVPSEVFYLDDDLDSLSEDWLRGLTASLIEHLEDGYYLRWEAKIRQEQGLILSAEQAAAITSEAALGLFRPREPWYQTIRRVAPVLADWFGENGAYWVDSPMGGHLVAAIEAHAHVLSLPHDCDSVSEVLPERSWHRLRVQSIYSALVGLGEPGPDGLIMTIENAPELLDELIAGLEERRESLRALGWGPRDVLNSFLMPDDERERVMTALAARGYTPDWPGSPC